MSTQGQTVTGGSAATDHDTSRYCGVRRRHSEETCRRPAGWGTDHVGIGACKLHGGTTSSHRKRAAVVAMARQVSEWGGRIDVTPPEALLELVQGKAAEVAYWNQLVAELSDEDRAGMLDAKAEQGLGPQGPVDTVTRQAGPHVYLVMLHKAQDQLATYSAAAIRAGVDEAMVRVAAVQAAAVVELARQAIAAARADLRADPDAILLALIGGQR